MQLPPSAEAVFSRVWPVTHMEEEEEGGGGGGEREGEGRRGEKLSRCLRPAFLPTEYLLRHAGMRKLA